MRNFLIFKRAFFKKALALFSMTGIFIFQACYGMPPEYSSKAEAETDFLNKVNYLSEYKDKNLTFSKNVQISRTINSTSIEFEADGYDNENKIIYEVADFYTKDELNNSAKFLDKNEIIAIKNNNYKDSEGNRVFIISKNKNSFYN